jgi:2-polyprenyl-3-methyl-5-hydroxy-6-metoxy-1,4-benzoquinol methylase
MSNIEFNEDSINCLICGSGSIHSFKAQAFDDAATFRVNIKECKSCYFAWQFPRGRTVEDSVGWFREAYIDKDHAGSDYFDANRKREISHLEAEFIASLPTENKTLLDIGAGAGIFAEVAAENGWNVTAVDPAINEKKFEDCTAINAITGTLDDIPKGQLFDVITLWDVIEHVDAPLELIKSAKEYLKKGGWLVIETGNYKSADRVIGGINHWMYQLDHRWYFSPDSMEYLLKECGFESITLSDKVLRPGWVGSVSYAGHTRAHLLKSVIKKPFHFPIHLAMHNSLKEAKNWKHGGIGIFALAARKS